MILIDFSQIFMSTFHTMGGSDNLDAKLLKHQVIDTILYFKNKFPKHGQLVITADSGNNWRKDILKEYKANRAKGREESGLDWNAIFEHLHNLIKDLKTHFPYKVIKVDKCEADDIISTLCIRFHQKEKMLIISSDKDFQQLQRYPNIEQFSPFHKKFLSPETSAELHLTELIIRGDASDGVPNIKSDDDTFVKSEKRQTSIQKKWLEPILRDYMNVDRYLTESEQINFKRNKKLIDLSEIPQELFDLIVKEFNDAKPAPYNKIYDYLIENKLNNLIDKIEKF